MANKYSSYLTHSEIESDYAHGEHNQNNISYFNWSGGIVRYKVTSKILTWCFIITFIFSLVELSGGYVSHSVVLQSDGVHMLTDALGFLVAIIASIVSKRPANINLTFGYGKADAIGALTGVMFTGTLILSLILQAIINLTHPHPVHGLSVIFIATIGLLVNSGLAIILMRESNFLNIKAVLIHVVGDIVGSLLAIISGFIVYLTNFVLIDPILSIIVILILVNSNYRLCKQALMVLMAGVPTNLNYEEIGRNLSQIKGVIAVHDLHVWYMSANKVSLSAHVIISNLYLWNDILVNCQNMLVKDYKIEHITLQPEIRVDYMGMNYCESQ